MKVIVDKIYFMHEDMIELKVPVTLYCRMHKTHSNGITNQRSRTKLAIPRFRVKTFTVGGASRWWKSKTQRSPSSPQIHQKYIYMWNSSYRTPTECRQKTSDFPKGKKFPTYLGRAREKRKNRDKGIGTGPAPVGGSCEGGKVSTH